MHNNTKIDSDGICIYVSISTKISIAGLLLLFVINAINIAVLLIAVTEGVLALLAASIVMAIFLIRYSLWNIYGKENLIINTKSISYQHDYGFFRTTYTTKPINKALQIQRVSAFQEKNTLLMKLSFVSYDEQHLPILLYTSTLQLTEQDTSKLIASVNQLFVDKTTDDYELPPIHLN